MTVLEEQFVTKLIFDGTIKFYIRYVDDTLIFLKRSDVNQVLNKPGAHYSNGLLRSLILNRQEFTVDTFLDHKVHFLDLLINKNIIRKPILVSVFRFLASHLGV